MVRLAKKIMILGVFAVIGVVVLLQLSDMQIQDATIPDIQIQDAVEDSTYVADIIMPTKSSRPGCEETDSCYIPSRITVKPGQPVTWSNQDSAFHSVTSGHYDSPTGDFDSGYMDPHQSFTMTFEQSGTVDYFCTLHPWMHGQVIVKS